MNEKYITSEQPCYFFKFGLFVTGETEEQHLPHLFRNLMRTNICTFTVERRIGQLSPITREIRLPSTQYPLLRYST